MSTTVINIKDALEGWEDNPEYVYIGRSNKNHHNIGWGNPYPLRTEADRAFILKQYIGYFNAKMEDDNLPPINRLFEKKLVCYCAPKLCHGDILALYANVVQITQYGIGYVPLDERFVSSEL